MFTATSKYMITRQLRGIIRVISASTFVNIVTMAYLIYVENVEL